MSFLYIPDEETDSIRFTDDLSLRDGYFFWGTWFNPKTGQFFRVAEIEDDLVRVSAILEVPPEQCPALLSEILEDVDESPLWASFVREVDKSFVEEWQVRLSRHQAEQGQRCEDEPAETGITQPRCGHCRSTDKHPDRNAGWQLCNVCRYTTRTDTPYMPPVQQLLRQIAAEVDAESVGQREWECDHDTAQNLGTIVGELADLAHNLGWDSLADEIRKTCTSITWKPDEDEKESDDHL